MRERLSHVDALRGVALFGIAQINVQSFTWGSGNVLAYLPNNHPPIDSVLYFLQSAFIEGKFYPLFAFLFGFGLMRQYESWSDQAKDGPCVASPQPQPRLYRRLGFLAIAGLLHGCLLYFGDVLLAYAVCGSFLVAWGNRSTPQLAALARALAVAASLGILAPVLLDAMLPNISDANALADALSTHHLYAMGSYTAQWPQHLVDEFWQQIGSIPTFWPPILFWMSLGALAHRHGWLDDPPRHAPLWGRLQAIGLFLGLPCALVGAGLDLQNALHRPGQDAVLADVLQGFGSTLMLAYAARLLPVLSKPPASWWVQRLANLGRVSFSAYVLQSLLMALLLCGWGLGWGEHASRLELTVLALAIPLLEGLMACLWLHHFTHGPLEILWRRSYRARCP